MKGIYLVEVNLLTDPTCRSKAAAVGILRELLARIAKHKEDIDPDFVDRQVTVVL